MLFLLAADIGGTNSRFALFALKDAAAAVPELELLQERWLPTARHESFADAARALRLPDGSPFVPQETALASLAVAGPVRDEKFCDPPNIAWTIQADEAAAALGVPKALLVNDFVAQGHACLLAALSERTRAKLEIAELYAGEKYPAPFALVGAGSGCGQALVLPEMRIVMPSEGGHGEFPFRREEEAFANFLRDSLGERIEMEMPASGDGLCRLFSYHCGESLPPAEVCSRLNPPRTVAEQKTLSWFARFYGRVCRAFVLNVMALGGLYVTGGIAARIPALAHPAFLESFQDSASMAHLLRKTPVFHIRSQQAGLWGAAAYGALRLMSAIPPMRPL